MGLNENDVCPSDGALEVPNVAPVVVEVGKEKMFAVPKPVVVVLVAAGAPKVVADLFPKPKSKLGCVVDVPKVKVDILDLQ